VRAVVTALNAGCSDTRHPGRRQHAVARDTRGRNGTLEKLALGLMGRVRPRPATAGAPFAITLPSPSSTGGMPLMDALGRRRSSREFSPDPIGEQLLSDLLWAANGVNRADGKRLPRARSTPRRSTSSWRCLGGLSLFAAGPQPRPDRRLRREGGHRLPGLCRHRAARPGLRGRPSRMALVPVDQRRTYARRPPVQSARMSICSQPVRGSPP